MKNMFQHRTMNMGSLAQNTDDTTVGTGLQDGSCLTTDGTVTLADSDIDSLIYMYEEEKLAGDVYETLADQYDLTIFEKIAASEDTHMEAIENLLVNAGVDISDLQSLDSGVYQNEDLQALYDSLIEQGSTSLEDALNVGVLIEETDIADLEEYFGDDAEISDVVENVYSHLETGSEHHLSAFNNALDNDYLLS